MRIPRIPSSKIVELILGDFGVQPGLVGPDKKIIFQTVEAHKPLE
jgi:hypothetical protein